jgi:hypothetical protein
MQLLLRQNFYESMKWCWNCCRDFSLSGLKNHSHCIFFDMFETYRLVVLLCNGNKITCLWHLKRVIKCIPVATSFSMLIFFMNQTSFISFRYTYVCFCGSLSVFVQFHFNSLKGLCCGSIHLTSISVLGDGFKWQFYLVMAWVFLATTK